VHRVGMRSLEVNCLLPSGTGQHSLERAVSETREQGTQLLWRKFLSGSVWGGGPAFFAIVFPRGGLVVHPISRCC
jgi:hypothetical protein